jgi:hypothetical protein
MASRADAAGDGAVSGVIRGLIRCPLGRASLCHFLLNRRIKLSAFASETLPVSRRELLTYSNLHGIAAAGELSLGNQFIEPIEQIAFERNGNLSGVHSHASGWYE